MSPVRWSPFSSDIPTLKLGKEKYVTCFNVTLKISLHDGTLLLGNTNLQTCQGRVRAASQNKHERYVHQSPQ